MNAVSFTSWVANTGKLRLAVTKPDDMPLYLSYDMPHILSELAVPLISTKTKNSVGVLDIHSISAEAFHEEECVFYMAVAEHIMNLLNDRKLS